MIDSFDNNLLAIMSASTTFWFVQLALVTLIRLFQIRDELFHWCKVDAYRKRNIGSLIGFWAVAVFVSLRLGRASLAWIDGKWAIESFASWHLLFGIFGVLWLLWWALSSVCGHRLGWRWWWASLGMGGLVGALANWLAV